MTVDMVFINSSNLCSEYYLLRLQLNSSEKFRDEQKLCVKLLKAFNDNSVVLEDLISIPTLRKNIRRSVSHLRVNVPSL
jgi:hypothetical protein